MLGHCNKDHLLCSEIQKALKTVQGTKWLFCAEYVKVKIMQNYRPQVFRFKM